MKIRPVSGLLLIFFFVTNIVLAAPVVDPCSDAAREARKTVRTYDSALREVTRNGADPIALANLSSAYGVVEAEYVALLNTCTQAPNSPPEVTINSPAAGAIYPIDSQIYFEASVFDPDADAINQYAWTSNIDGVFGNLLAFETVLSSGVHTITVEATDSRGAVGSASTSITVESTQTGSIALSSIDPSIAFVGTAQPLTISAINPPPTGQVGFAAGATVAFVNSAGASTQSGSTMIDASQIITTLPSSLIGDVYDVNVTNPDGSFGVLTQSFQVTDVIGISLTAVSPSTFQGINTIDLTIVCEINPTLGLEGFQAGATVQFFESSSGAALIPSNTILIDATTLQATIDAGAFPGVYDLVVINPSGSAGVLPNAISITQ